VTTIPSHEQRKRPADLHFFLSSICGIQ
jgi:hypothetical protein